MASITLTAIDGIPMVAPGDDLARMIADAAASSGVGLLNGDILLVCQKVVSKSEGRVCDLKAVEPSALARNFAARWDKDPRLVELVLRHTNRIVRMDRGVLISETGPGWVCANAGIDQSNSLGADIAILLPVDPDASAASLRASLRRLTGVDVVVLITDTFGRPWREGQTDVCLGIAGMEPMIDLRGSDDLNGRELHHTILAVADQLAAAAGLLMDKAAATPAVLARGYKFAPGATSAKNLIRAAEADLFR